MLHAINARKVRLDRVIDGIGKQPREDLITSALFGTVQFLSPLGRSMVLKALIGEEVPSNSEIFLWPYLKCRGENAEPDVVLRLGDKSGSAYWIVEVKWGASLGNEQIGREIRTLQGGECRRGDLPAEERKVIGYTLLGAEEKHARFMQEAQRDFPDLSFQSVTWPDVTMRLRRLVIESADDPGLTTWARTAVDFLTGTPRGSVLGEWPPGVVMPAAAMFTFMAGRQFDYGSGIVSVPAAQFIYTERDT